MIRDDHVGSMKLVQFWVPDTSSAEFKAEARRQSRLIAQSLHEASDQAFIDGLADQPGN